MSNEISKYAFWLRMGNVLSPMINAWTYEKETREHFERRHATHRLDPPDNVIKFLAFDESCIKK